MWSSSFIFVVILPIGFTEIDVEKQQLFSNAFINFINNLPDQPYVIEDSVYDFANKIDENDDNYYNIGIKVKATDVLNGNISKYLKCSAIVNDLDQSGISFQNNQYQCEDVDAQQSDDETDTRKSISEQQSTTETIFYYEPVQLVNEVEANTGEIIITPNSATLANTDSVEDKIIHHNDIQVQTQKEMYLSDDDVKNIGSRIKVNDKQISVTELGEVEKSASAKENRNPQLIFNTESKRYVEDNSVQIKLTDFSEKVKNSDRTKAVNDLIIFENGGSYRGKSYLPGGIAEKDPNDPRFLSLAQESLNQYLTTSGDTRPHIILQILKASEQVVAGTLTRIDFVAMTSNSEKNIICHSKIWDRPWLGKKEIDVNCDENGGSYRGKRQLPGGIAEKDPNDPRFLPLAQESLNQYLTTSGDTRPHIILQILKASEQVVAGTLTRIDFVARPSNSGNSIICHSKIWDRPWLGKKEIDVNCDENGGSYRAKRHLTGGIAEKDPTDPRYLPLAQESLNQYLTTSGDTRPHIILQILKASEQVVAGTLTRIDFVARPSNSGKSIICHSKIWDRPWLGKKEIDVNCDENGGSYRAKRHLTGGIAEKDPTDPRYLPLAQESLNQYLTTSGDTRPHIIIQILKASEQVVAGTLTRIDFVARPSNSGKSIICHSKIWDRPWLGKKEIDVNCDENGGSYRAKRHLTGGIAEKDPTDPRYLPLAQESLNQYLTTSGDTRPHIIIQILKASEQVVAGTLTRIDFVARPSNSGKSIICHSKIWDRPWLGKKEIDVNCDENGGSYRTKRHLTGGIAEKDPTDPRYLPLAQESLDRYLKTSGNTRPHIILQILKASEQVVAGTLTRIDFVARPSNSGKSIICHSKIWDRPWLGKKEIDVSCDENV